MSENKYDDILDEFTEDVKEAILQFCESEGFEPDDLDISEDGQALRISMGSRDYALYLSYDDAEQAAIESVRDMLETDLDSFSEDFLGQHINAVNARQVAVEDIDARIEDLSDDDILSESGIDTSELDELQDKIDALYNEDNDEEAEALEHELDRVRDDLIENAKDELRDTGVDDLEAEIEYDPLEYYSGNFGYSFQEMLKSGLIEVDITDAAEEAVKVDGVAHSLAYYDGEENELPSGAVYYRQN